MSAPAAAESDAATAFAERTRILAIDDRCGILTGPERLAMEAGRIQSRNALVWAGAREDALAGLAARHADISDNACVGDDVALVSRRVSDAYKAWAQIKTMDFPGDRRVWRAARPDRDVDVLWRISQSAPNGVRFGVVSAGDTTSLAFARPLDGTAVRSVRLIVRDPVKLSWSAFEDIDRLMRPASGGGSGLAERTPPAAMTSVYWAGGRLASPPLVDGGRGEDLFSFSLEALLALENLDARDVAMIEVERAGGGGVELHAFEVGDFLAAEIFAFIEY